MWCEHLQGRDWGGINKQTCQPWGLTPVCQSQLGRIETVARKWVNTKRLQSYTLEDCTVYIYIYIYIYIYVHTHTHVHIMYLHIIMYLHRASWHSSAAMTEVFRAFSSVVRQMPGYNSPRWGTARTLPKILCCSMYCLCVNVYCTTATGWQPNCS